MKTVFWLLASTVLVVWAVNAADWDKTVNLCLYDRAWNVSCTEQNIHLDTSVPAITVTESIITWWTNTAKNFKADISDSNLDFLWYKVVAGGTDCESITEWTEVPSIDLTFDDESFNWKKLCIKASDPVNDLYYESTVIDKIDMTPPAEPNYYGTEQIGWNKVQVKWEYTYEEWLELVILDNWWEIQRLPLDSSGKFDVTVTLSEPPRDHNVTYYIVDRAWNKAWEEWLDAIVDSSWYLGTPWEWAEVWKIISFTWFTLPGKDVSIYNWDWEIIATTKSDSNWRFFAQTPVSQALGNMQIDLAVDWIKKNEPRNIVVVADAVKVPVIDEDSVQSKYLWDKQIFQFENQEISFSAEWEPLSEFRIYSISEPYWEPVITDIWIGQFDADWNADVTSYVQLPGWENKIYIVDTVHKVSSHIIYITIVDPTWTVYDSESKSPIAWAKVSFCDEWTNTLAVFPDLHGAPQPNPYPTESDGKYYVYANPGEKYYVCWVSANGYSFPSVKILPWVDNLDWSPNTWAHWEVFEVMPYVTVIDIPVDKVEKVSSGGWGWGGWSNFQIVRAPKGEEFTAWHSSSGRKLEIVADKWTKTERKVNIAWFQNKFSWWVYADWVYKFMYRKNREGYHEGAMLNKDVTISITHPNVAWNVLYIKRTSKDKYVSFGDYEITSDNTLRFTIDRWFSLKFISKKSILEKKWIDFMSIEEALEDKLNTKYEFRLDSYFEKRARYQKDRVSLKILNRIKEINDEKEWDIPVTYKFLNNYLINKYLN